LSKISPGYEKIILHIIIFFFISIDCPKLSVTTTVCSDASSVRMTGPWWQWNLTAGPEASNNVDGTRSWAG